VLVVSDIAHERLDQLAAELGSSAVAVAADIASPGGRRAIVGAVSEPIAWIVLAHGVPLRKPLAELDEREIADTFEVNLVAPTLLLRLLLDREWSPASSIVVVGSTSATRALPQRAVYGASKAGVEHLARSLAAELGPAGIRVNVVSPGVIDTPFLGNDTRGLEAWLQSRVPVARAGQPDEVARLVEFVVLHAPAYFTGARLAVDGGTEALG
jgi:NAD(P)-dependent dehydrogenase (short-subunit alcohol dehydrogenase family)